MAVTMFLEPSALLFHLIRDVEFTSLFPDNQKLFLLWRALIGYLLLYTLFEIDLKYKVTE